MPSSTRCRPFAPRDSFGTFPRSSVSRLMFSRCKPAAFRCMPPVRRAECRWLSARCRECPARRPTFATSARQIVPHQRFAAGEPDFVDAQLSRQPARTASISSNVRISSRGRNSHVLRRHAIKAADVAAIGDADPQVIVFSAEAIEEHFVTCDLSLVVHRSAFRIVACRVHPFFGAIGPVFAFPNRHFFFNRIDQPAAGGKCVVAVRGADGHRHAHFAEK